MRSNIWRGFMLALWFDITHTQTKTHSTHRGQQTDTTIQIYIKTIFYVLIAAICITLNESFADIKTLFYRVLQCLCFLKIVEVAYLLIRFNKTRFFPRNTKNTDRYDVNKENTKQNTPHSAKDMIGKGWLLSPPFLISLIPYFTYHEEL